jgi:hypothetical protein
MHKVVQRLCLIITIFGIFCLAGFVANNFPILHENIITSTAVFGVSFVSLISGAFRWFTDLFN